MVFFKKEKTNLLKIAEKFGTDKVEHGYIKYYEKHLPKTPLKILELGVLNGASIKMWKEYFPYSEISCLDLFQENVNVKSELESLNIKCYKGSQDDYSLLYQIPDVFDIIIDDASHVVDKTIISFKHLFVNNLKYGGVYVVEDLHCHEDRFFYGNVKRPDDTLLHSFKYWDSKKGIPFSTFFDSHQKCIFDSIINDVKLYDNKIAFVFKNIP